MDGRRVDKKNENGYLLRKGFLGDVYRVGEIRPLERGGGDSPRLSIREVFFSLCATVRDGFVIPHDPDSPVKV
jgi:hypothetical protein